MLNSPALNYTVYNLAEAVEQTRQLKLLQEQPEDDLDSSRAGDENKPTVSSQNFVFIFKENYVFLSMF